MAALHNLKCWIEPFDAIWRGDKRAEFRQGVFEAGDILMLQRFDQRVGKLSGEYLVCIATHVQIGFGMPEGFAMVSIRVERGGVNGVPTLTKAEGGEADKTEEKWMPK